MEVSNVVRFTYSGNPILDLGQKSVVELMLEWHISPLDMHS